MCVFHTVLFVSLDLEAGTHRLASDLTAGLFPSTAYPVEGAVRILID